jgi:LysR family glycine cleavage system transcriptional activator/LysR family transcriptional regulator of beta-lactamase
MRRLPSLNGLRAFEAAARHGSFVAAGNELNVTQAAVSRLVRLLEARLGFPLFERLPNGLVLTAQGKALQPGLTAAFDAIAGITEQVAAMRRAPVLMLGVGPTFAVRWLIPRLASFHQRHPEIDVRLATGGAINPFKDDWTCGIVLGNGDWPDLAAEPLFSADLFPVCTAAIAQQLAQPSDLNMQDLLQVVHSPEDWPLWLEAAGVDLRSKTPGPRFDNYAMALQAAVDGLGVAIGLRPYVQDDIAAGRLVAPFALAVPKGRAWYLVYRPFRQDDPSLVAFRDWLRGGFPSTGVGAAARP